MLPKLPAFTLPPIVARAVTQLPMRPLEFVLTRTLDFGVGRIVDADAVAPLVGRSFVLSVRDLGVAVRFAGTPAGFRPVAGEEPPDLAISATLRDFIALALREEDPDTLFFSRRLRVEGDTELGLTVKNLLDGIDWASAARRLLRELVPAFLRPGGARS
jgi:predicted lipid carrier protein YhbT